MRKSSWADWKSIALTEAANKGAFRKMCAHAWAVLSKLAQKRGRGAAQLRGLNGRAIGCTFRPSGQGVHIRLKFDSPNKYRPQAENDRDARSQDGRPQKGNNGSITWPFHVVTFYGAARVRSALQRFHFQSRL